MNETTLQALRASIEHHKRIVARMPDETLGAGSCALCGLFIKGGCLECPVRERTGYAGCRLTPYHDIDEHLFNEHHGRCRLASNCAECTRLEQLEIDFLESLLPKEEEEEEEL
jgi:hypothetical protein